MGRAFRSSSCQRGAEVSAGSSSEGSKGDPLARASHIEFGFGRKDQAFHKDLFQECCDMAVGFPRISHLRK